MVPAVKGQKRRGERAAVPQVAIANFSYSEFSRMFELVFAVISGPNAVIENQTKQEDTYARREDW